VLSLFLSPVGRAGEAVVLFLFPALWAAAGIGRLLASDAARRWASGGCAILASALAVWALALQGAHEQGRAALPVGHHNQLALVLVALLPVAVLGAVRLVPADRPHLRWGTGLVVAILMTSTLAATGSFSGLLALLIQVALAGALLLWRRVGSGWTARIGVFLVLALVLALWVAWSGSRLGVPGPVERVGAVLRLEDPSMMARRTYAEAALQGFAERPVVGWGPGSTAWTLGHHLRPAPGVHPPGEVVTDAHSLIVQAPYEVGIPGAVLFVLVAFLYGRRRLGELIETARLLDKPPPAPAEPPVRDPELLSLALLGFLGGAVCLAFGVFAVVTAVPAVFLFLLGLAAASRRDASRRPPRPPGWRGVLLRSLVPVWLVLTLGWSAERSWAARQYELARARSDGETITPGPVDPVTESAAPGSAGPGALLWRAVELDPGFPLYRSRLDPWGAAESASGLAPLWLLAGIDPLIEAERREAALEMACDLDPLSALAPFELMRLLRAHGTPADNPRVVERAARAVLAEPLLLAAVAFEGDPDLRQELLARVQSWPGLPPGWLAAFEELWFRLEWSSGGEGAPVDVLSVDADGRPAVSLSLFAFRRQPWPFSIGAVPLRSHRLEVVAARDLPAVTRLPETAPEPFWIRRCGLGP